MSMEHGINASAHSGVYAVKVHLLRLAPVTYLFLLRASRLCVSGSCNYPEISMYLYNI